VKAFVLQELAEGGGRAPVGLFSAYIRENPFELVYHVSGLPGSEFDFWIVCVNTFLDLFVGDDSSLSTPASNAYAILAGHPNSYQEAAL
jgi:hypothetical protein